MKLYLTGGQFKGRKIETPKNVKPTLSKVRESIFNILQGYEFEDKTFLDMCAGSAIMGLEAISRGYKTVELEINPKTASIIKKNYTNIGIEPNIIITDCLKYKTEDKYEIIYIDPPWANNYEKYIVKAYELSKDNGLIILEYDEKNPIQLDEIIKNNSLSLDTVNAKKYGRCLIRVLQKNP